MRIAARSSRAVSASTVMLLESMLESVRTVRGNRDRLLKTLPWPVFRRSFVFTIQTGRHHEGRSSIFI